MYSDGCPAGEPPAAPPRPPPASLWVFVCLGSHTCLLVTVCACGRPYRDRPGCAGSTCTCHTRGVTQQVCALPHTQSPPRRVPVCCPSRPRPRGPGCLLHAEILLEHSAPGVHVSGRRRLERRRVEVDGPGAGLAPPAVPPVDGLSHRTPPEPTRVGVLCGRQAHRVRPCHFRIWF